MRTLGPVLVLLACLIPGEARLEARPAGGKLARQRPASRTQAAGRLGEDGRPARAGGGTSRGARLRDRLGATRATGGRNRLGATRTTGGRSRLGATRTKSGRTGLGATRGTGRRTGLGATRGKGARSGRRAASRGAQVRTERLAGRGARSARMRAERQAVRAGAGRATAGSRLARWPARALRLGSGLRVFERVARIILPRLGGISIGGLTLAGARGIGRVSRTGTGVLLAATTGIAGAALTVASAIDLVRARNHAERADAAHGMAWGLQSLGSVGQALFTSSSWMGGATRALGVGGGAIQTGVGLFRIGRGLRTGDRKTAIVGALDTGAGLTWAASSVTGNPIALGAFLGLTAVRMVYTNSDAIKAAGKRIAGGARRVLERARGATTRLAQTFAPRWPAGSGSGTQ